MKRVAWLLATLIVTHAGSARADNPRSYMVDPSASSTATTPTATQGLVSSLTLDATKESKKVKARVAHASDHLLLSLTFTGPISESATQASPASLDGLSDGASAEANATWILWDPQADITAQTRVCADLAIDKYECDPDKLPAPLHAEAVAAQKLVCDKYHAEGCTREALPNDAARSEFDRAAEPACAKDLTALKADPIKASQRVDCSSAGLAHFPTYRKRFDDATDYGQAYLASVKLEANNKNFEFADATTYAADEQNHTGLSASATLGAVLDDIVYLSVSYEFQRSWKAGDASDICSPLGMMGYSSCKSLALGAPTKRTSSLFHLELRRFFSKSVALGFRAHYDTDADVFSVEIPLYFLQNEDGGLAGGVTAGFRSDEDAPTLGVFVAEAFTLVPSD